MHALDTIRALERQAREAAMLARATQLDAERVAAELTCIGCSHAKHVALRCHEIAKFTMQPCGCDLHFGLWPDEEGYVSPLDARCPNCNSHL